MSDTDRGHKEQSESRMARVAVHVKGVVQGVGYRQWTLRCAETLRLAGWVRNEPDGSVRAELEGPQDALRDAVTRMRQGPPAARVDILDLTDRPVQGDQGFRIVRD